MGASFSFFKGVLILVSTALESVLSMQIELDNEKVCCNPFFPWLTYYS